MIDIPPVQSSYRVHALPSDAALRARIRRAGTALAAISLVVLVIAVIAWRVSRRSGTPRQSGPQIRSLAVLPLTNLSSDPEQDYFSEGLTEALTNDLGKFSALRVISRTSTMQYKSTKKTVPEIARDLDIDAVIEGTVLRSGNHVRITVNLIQANPEKHLWAESYEADAGDIMNVQAAVTLSVAREIQITLTPSSDHCSTAVRLTPLLRIFIFADSMRGTPVPPKGRRTQSAIFSAPSKGIQSTLLPTQAWLSR